MFYIVPKGRSIISSVGKTEDRQAAKLEAERFHVETGDHFDVIEHKLVWTTQTLGELLEEDEQAL